MAKKSTKNEAVEQVVPAGYVPALKTVYNEQIIPALMKQFSYTTVMQVPKLVKITINEGVGEASQNQSHDKKLVEDRKQFSPLLERISPTSISVKVSLSV